jgi:hypothetical protein
MEKLTAEFLLHKYWSQEILDTYNKIGLKSFCKWRVPIEDVKKYLSDEDFEKLEKLEEKERYYFFQNFFFTKLRRCGEFIYGIGIDPERKTKPSILYLIRGGIKIKI